MDPWPKPTQADHADQIIARVDAGLMFLASERLQLGQVFDPAGAGNGSRAALADAVLPYCSEAGEIKRRSTA